MFISLIVHYIFKRIKQNKKIAYFTKAFKLGKHWLNIYWDDTKLQLDYGFQFQDLYTLEGLKRLDALFLEKLSNEHLDYKNLLISMRQNYQHIAIKEQSSFFLELVPFVENFITSLFNVQQNNNDLKNHYLSYLPLTRAKKLFIQRRIHKNYNFDKIQSIDILSIKKELTLLLGANWSDLKFATKILNYLDNEEKYVKEIQIVSDYTGWALFSEEGKQHHKESALFKMPEKLNFEYLIHHLNKKNNRLQKDDASLRHRDAFALTDQGSSTEQSFDQVHYCIFCHHQGKDSCSKGLKAKTTLEFQRNPFNIPLTGCPLEEKISEMNQSVSEGFILGALAIAMIDNPLLPLTGHRICNECMKACIYQKQEPVNIPAIETKVLRDILSLPWGVEIYSLLTRWNPVNFERPLPKDLTNHKILVAGTGPAGINLSHHLLNEGFAVFAIDGLKIEPLSDDLIGPNFKPMRDFNQIQENLDERVIGGFGGVAEYGITVRWDKNFLKLVRIILERRNHFHLKGGIRLGSNITIEQAFLYGFDHIALALGAGKPNLVPIQNNLAKGVRMASDFLMALQLTGAAQKSSLANLELRLPVIVIGGGLTAIDTATEAMVYYPRQIEKFLHRYETLKQNNVDVDQHWSDQEKKDAQIWIDHAHILRHEKKLALLEKRDPNYIKLIQSWGGVSIAYRKTLQESPSYTLNHEEVAKAFEEGIYFIENIIPIEIELDENKVTKGLKVKQHDIDLTLPAKTILIAAGTQPNIVLKDESPYLKTDGNYFEAHNLEGVKINPEKSSKPNEIGIFTYTHPDNRRISYFGDLHPSYAGNVVKAMASAKQGYPSISKHLETLKPTNIEFTDLFKDLNIKLTATIIEVNRLTPTIVEIVLKAPIAAQNFKPGQFYRLQNFETNAPKNTDTSFSMEGIALTGSWVDISKGLLGLIVLEMGGSSSLCTYLQPNEEVLLMGPTGTPTTLPSNKNVLLVGGGLGNAVLFSIGKELKQKGSKVLYAAGYKKIEDRYKVQEIEEAADHILWCCDENPGFEIDRPQDFTFVGNIVEAMVSYARGDLGDQPIHINDIDHIIVIGSDRMMAAVQKARHTILKPYLKKHTAIGSINSPMQCMMKEICAQCLQRQIDPETGTEKFVFSCNNQDQDLDVVDFTFLNQRLAQNTIQEKLTSLWIKHIHPIHFIKNR